MKSTAIMFSFIAVLFACQKSLQTSAQTSGGDVSVVMTSDAGDRLTSKPNLFWGSGYNATAPIITVDPGITNQTIDGFGASFLEAGMICLNSLDSASRGNVLTKLFDPVNGSGFSCMKTYLGACDFTCATGSLCFHFQNELGNLFSLLTITTMVVFIGSFAVSFGPLSWLLILEIFPFKFRGLGMIIGAFTVWSATTIVNYSFL